VTWWRRSLHHSPWREKFENQGTSHWSQSNQAAVKDQPYAPQYDEEEGQPHMSFGCDDWLDGENSGASDHIKSSGIHASFIGRTRHEQDRGSERQKGVHARNRDVSCTATLFPLVTCTSSGQDYPLGFARNQLNILQGP
jgi:hypothetical protein